MAYFVRAPGTCGEFLQGSIGGQQFLVTCPINRYSYALSDVTHPLPTHRYALQPKASEAQQRVLQVLGIDEDVKKPIYLRSELVQGKGMASSSADISAVAMATALNYGRTLTMKELEQICLSIEPSDASFYPSIVQFDYREGNISEVLGPCPPMKILIFDEEGIVDTVSFNARPDLLSLVNEKEEIIKESLSLFKKGIACHNVAYIGEAATLSAFGNQRILPKQHLYELHHIGSEFNSLGVIIAHSGTIMGLLFPSDHGNIEQCKQEVLRQIPSLSYLDLVETTNEGITFMKR